MTIDDIFQEMSLQNMTDIDDIDCILVTGETLGRISEEFRILFDVPGHVSVRELEDYFGSPIKLTMEFIGPNGWTIERTD